MMSKRIFVSGLFHETHTFLASKTGMDDFALAGILHENEIVEKNRGNGSPMDGFLWSAEQHNWEVIPGIQMTAMPSGTVTDEAVRYFHTHFFNAIKPVFHSLDAIYLVLHGAMVSESLQDVEGDLLKELHAFMMAENKAIPVVAVLDLHANVSQSMCDFSTCLFGYRENPHTDARDSAIKAADILRDILENQNEDIVQIFRNSEFIIPPSGLNTDKEPMKSLLEYVRIKEADDPDLLCINIWAGYAYADIADCGFSLSCCTYGDAALANAYFDDLMALLKRNIAAGYPFEYQLDDALSIVDQEPVQSWPVLLIEASDNIGGGSPGDATGVLGPMLKTGRKGIVAIINDPEAVGQCVRVGSGSEIQLEIGAKTDEFHGEPILFKGTIIRLSNGEFELENKNSHLASMGGIYIRMGPCAVVRNDQAEILLTTFKTPPMDLGQLHSHCIVPEKARYVVVKAAVSHMQAYGPIAANSFYIDSPGLCTSNLTCLPYQNTGNKIKALKP